MKKCKEVFLINNDSTLQVDFIAWSEMLLFLNDRGWKPRRLLTSFLGNKEVSISEVEQIRIVGKEVLNQVLKDPISIYPVPFDMGKFAEIIHFCEEGSFKISVE